MTTDSITNGTHKQTLAERYDISLEKLEPSYIEKSSNVKELEKILRILKSGEEGYFPHIEEKCEARITNLNPKSRILRKETPLITTKELSDKDNILDDIKSWTSEMKNKDTVLSSTTDQRHRVGPAGDENLPPVRGGVHLTGSKKTNKKPEKKNNKKVAPRDYREWDKIIHEMKDDDENEEENSKKQSAQNSAASTEAEVKKAPKSLATSMKTDGLTEVQKIDMANREKDKGNEAFRSGDFAEAIAYYNRSLSVIPTAATYNNRALAYIRVSKWSDAASDCNRVLKEEPANLKAKLRRACAYKSLRKFKQAKQDLDEVLEIEPQNKRAQDIMKDVEKELTQADTRKAEGKGHRMVIEETDGEDSDGDEEQEEIIIKPGGGVERSNTAPVAASTETPAAVSEQMTEVKVNNQQAEPDKFIPVEEPSEPVQKPSKRIVIEEDSSSDEESDDEGDQSPVQTPSTNTEADPQAIPEKTFDTPPGSPRTQAKRQANRSSSSLLSIIQQKIATDTEQAPAASSNEQTDDPPAVSTANDTHSTVVKSSAAPEISSTEPKPDQVTEAEKQPEVVYVPALPANLETLKQRGNELFKSGQYGEAASCYTKALKSMQDESMMYHAAIVLSNLSACHIKNGNCREALSDCDQALSYIPHHTKALLRRATAYEMLEKYKESYVDYRHVINLDPNASTAYAGANRCEAMLSQQYGGGKWRTSIPKIPTAANIPRYEIVSDIAAVKQPAVTVTKQTKAASPPPESTARRSEVTEPKIEKEAAPTPEPKAKVETNEEKFTRLKDLGNKMVSSSKFKEAAQYYSQAIQLFPDRVAPYSNRSLCHIKCDNPGLAVKDCDTVLAIEPNHVKAMYRRALANKVLSKYKESLSDLMSILKLEPGNTAAKKESELVKEAYKKQLISIKSTEKSSTAKQPATGTNKQSSNQQSAAQTNKQTSTKTSTAKRIQIIEDSETESEPSPRAAAGSTPPAAESNQQNKSQSKSARNKKRKQAKKTAAAAAAAKTQEKSQQQQAGSVASVPTLSNNPTPYEFTQAWTSMKHIHDTEPYARLIRQIPPKNLASVLSNKLEADMMEKIVLCLDKHFSQDDYTDVERYLVSLSSVPRFSMITMFMSPSCKSSLESLFSKLQPVSTNVDKLRIAYSM